MSNPFEVYLQKMRTIIAEHRVAVQTVATTPARYSYTIGLTPRLGFELIAVGLPPRLLSDVAFRLLDQGDVADGEKIEQVANVPFKLRTISTLEGTIDRRPIINIAVQLGYEPERVRLVLWPDERGNFPDEAGYSHGVVQDIDQFLERSPNDTH